jgi:predicted Zn-dependent peptidase
MHGRTLAGTLAFFLAAPLLGQSLEEKVTEFTLPNGFHFLIVERHESPVFVGLVRFKVGSVDEVPGITGLAHLFEHMVFKGTTAIGTRTWEEERAVLDEIERVGEALSRAAAGDDEGAVESLHGELEALQQKHQELIVPGEFSRIYDENGGTFLNASTGADLTTYFVALPSSRLELWMLMESERFKHPVMREFYKERDVVAEERRMRIETNPGGALYEALIHAAFATHPYRIETVGYMSDLKTVTVGDAEKFFAEHYVPQNSVVALVGDVDPAYAVELAQKYFSDVPKAPDPPPVRTVEPKQKGERRVRLEFDAEPGPMMAAYHVPAWPHEDYYALRALSYALTEGRASRLEKALVKEGVASDVGSWFGPGERYPHLFMLSADPIAPHTTEEVERVLYRELKRLEREPITKRELERIRNNLQADAVRRLGSNYWLAFSMTEYELLTGSWRNMLTYVDEVGSVTAEDVQRVAKTYLTESNRTVAVRVKKAGPPEGTCTP